MQDTDDTNLEAGTASAPPPVPASTPDTGSFTLAASGADVLEEKYRKSEHHEAPNTDHLSVEEP